MAASAFFVAAGVAYGTDPVAAPAAPKLTVEEAVMLESFSDLGQCVTEQENFYEVASKKMPLEEIERKFGSLDSQIARCEQITGHTVLEFDRVRDGLSETYGGWEKVLEAIRNSADIFAALRQRPLPPGL